MSCLVPNRLHSFLLAAGGVLACALTADSAGAGQRGQPIQFSAPRDEVTSTNISQLRKKQLQDELLKQQLKEDLVGSLDLFSAKDSLGGVAARPVRPPVPSPAQNQRIKQMLELRKNWVFMMPGDLKNEPTLEELFKLREYDRDGQERKELSPLERFYESLDRERLGATNRVGDRFAGSHENRRDDSFFPRANADPLGNPPLQTETKLKELFDKESGLALLPRRNGGSIFSDLFGSTELGQMERTPAQKARLEEFKQLLEPRSPFGAPATTANSLSTLPGALSPASILSATPRPVVEPLFGSISAGVGTSPAGFRDSNAKASGQSSLAPAPPREAARMPQPILPPPKRRF